MLRGYHHDYGGNDGPGENSDDDDFSTESQENGSRKCTNHAHRGELLAELVLQRENGKFLDVVVEVGDKKFPCHRAVLASTPYFKAMLSSSLCEGNSEVIKLHGVDSSSFGKILDFVYTGEIYIGKHDVQDILQTAHMLQFDKILKYCEDFIEENLCPSNCLGVLRLAEKYDLSVLKERARKEAVSYFSEVGQSTDFLTLSTVELLDLLKDEDLKVTTEEVVVNAVMRWLDYAPESRKKEVSRIFQEIHLTRLRVSVLSELETHAVVQECTECLAKITAAKKDHLVRTRQQQTSIAKSRCRRGMSDDLAIIVGGWKAVEDWQDFNQPLPLDRIICVDPDSRECYHVTNLPTSVSGCMSVARSADGRLYVTGGRVHPLVGQVSHSAPSKQAFCYDFSSDAWSRLPDMPRGRAGHQSVVVGGKLFVIGGGVVEKSSAFTSMDCYDIAEAAWTKPPELPNIYASSTLTVTSCGDKLVLVEVLKETVPYLPRRSKVLGATDKILHRTLPAYYQKLCVHALDVNTELWACFLAYFPVKDGCENVHISSTAVGNKLYLHLCEGKSYSRCIAIYHAKRETLVDNKKERVVTQNSLTTHFSQKFKYMGGQKGIIDEIRKDKFNDKSHRVKDTSPIPLPFALFGHSFLEAEKSNVGWYCRDLVQLEKEEEWID